MLREKLKTLQDLEDYKNKIDFFNKDIQIMIYVKSELGYFHVKETVNI